MTPDFDPTRVDWNNPDVEYLMKHFKMVTANRDDEIAALTKSNEELRMAYGKLEAKYDALIGMYSGDHKFVQNNAAFLLANLSMSRVNLAVL